MEPSSNGGEGIGAGTLPGARRYAAGDVISGKYRLRSLLGEGGMGAVWLARNSVLDVDVAIKLIRHGIGSPEASERLLQEARAAARLEHPSIIRIFDFGATEEGDPFIAMEMLRGESFAQLLDRRGRLSASDAVRTLLPVASAVCAAHAKGIVHRDLKPDNVLLTENDSGSIVPKVVDFGIAKVRDEGMAYRSLTQAGAILGSPDYMCPEQARGRSDVDEKCDVWALAVMLYECLAGKRPFNGDNYNALIASIMEDEPTPTTAFAAGDDALWEIVREGLSKDRTLRPTMRSFGERLAQWALQGGAHSDVSGVSLGQWLTVPVRKPFSEPAIAGPTQPTTRRGDLPTRSGVDDEARPPSTTGPPVASTRSEWSSPPRKSRPVVRIVVGAALFLAAVGTTWVSLRRPATSGVAVAAPPTAAPALDPTAPAATTETTVSAAPAAPSAQSATSSVPASSPPAAVTPAPATPATHRRNGKAGAAKPEPTLSVPARPNF